MDILITLACAIIAIGVLVFIHEGGHFLAARAFGVRVTELMFGLPGPSIGFTRNGTRFGITAVPLGGYARICGMEAGEMEPHLKEVLAALYRRGTANMEDIAADCGITDDEAYNALEELVVWGSCTGPTKQDEFNTYRATATLPPRKRSKGPKIAGELEAPLYAAGEARPVTDEDALFESEYRQQYRALPFWKRSVILFAGVAANLLFVIFAVVFIYSVVGYDYTLESGEVMHYHAPVWESIVAAFSYIGLMIQTVAGLFNPATAADVVSDSTSIVGIAVMSRTWFEAGFVYALEFMAMISTSLGIMNLIPIPPLDGGRLAVETFQKLTGKTVSENAMARMTLIGMALFLVLFAVMLNQDIQRFVFGNW